MYEQELVTRCAPRWAWDLIDETLVMYEQELVTRCAPRWAWDLIDETLVMDSNSKAFDRNLRTRIRAALDAMIEASEGE